MPSCAFLANLLEAVINLVTQPGRLRLGDDERGRGWGGTLAILGVVVVLVAAARQIVG